MHFHLDGSIDVKLDQHTAYQRLTDLELMAKALPDIEEIKMIDNDSAEATVKLRIGLVSTRLRMNVKISDKNPSSHAVLSAEGSGSGSHIKISSIFRLERANDMSTTKMSWSAEAEITGVMAGIGSTILKGFAEKRVIEILDAIGSAVEK